MNGSFLRRAGLAATLAAAVLASPVTMASDTPAAATASDPPDSGFLPDYSLLKPVKSASGNSIERWVSPKLSRENYHAIIVDQVGFHPKPQPSSQVSQETLDRISAYLTTTLSDVVLAAVPHTTEPGPGVLRVRTAITAVSTGATSLKPYELVPAAFVFSGAIALKARIDEWAESAGKLVAERLAQPSR